MITLPIKMILQELSRHEPKEVYVYSFINNTYEPLDTYALCWDNETHIWITVPISHLKPILEEVDSSRINDTKKKSKKSLKEDTIS